MGSRGSLIKLVRTYADVTGESMHTELGESNQLAAILTSFIDPVDGLLD